MFKATQILNVFEELIMSNTAKLKNHLKGYAGAIVTLASLSGKLYPADIPKTSQELSKNHASVTLENAIATGNIAVLNGISAGNLSRLLTQRTDYGEIPLHRAIRTRTKERRKVIKSLLKHHAESQVNVANNDGETPLHIAVRMQDPTSVALLIGKGAKVDKRNNNGLCPKDLIDQKDLEEGNTETSENETLENYFATQEDNDESESSETSSLKKQEEEVKTNTKKLLRKLKKPATSLKQKLKQQADNISAKKDRMSGRTKLKAIHLMLQNPSLTLSTYRGMHGGKQIVDDTARVMRTIPTMLDNPVAPVTEALEIAREHGREMVNGIRDEIVDTVTETATAVVGRTLHDGIEDVLESDFASIDTRSQGHTATCEHGDVRFTLLNLTIVLLKYITNLIWFYVMGHPK